MNYIFLITLLLSTACSFKSKDNEKAESGSDIRRPQVSLPSDDLKNVDSDGDKISDFDEIEQGLDRYIANLPKIKVNFLQDYNITVLFEDASSFVMDTQTARDNPDFKYRVGNLFLKENSFNNAAKLGRFSGTSWGDIKQQDFSWIKYPEIDKDFYFQKAREYRSFTNNNIKESSITLENTLKLMESPLFESIEQVELNFYYYSYAKESYVLLHTKKLDRTFQAGTREDFQITILNPPAELIEDSYFRHGEFIISEVKDFYIPNMKIMYSDLLDSVKAKSIPIYKTTPFDFNLDYVAVKKEGESFIDLLAKLFPDKYTVFEDQLTQIEQFTNNLPDYTYLHEVINEDKQGKWFIMINKIKEHYLKHKFTSSDAITLSYLTGSDLATRVSEKVYSFSEDIKAGKDGKLYALGNITNNSNIEISLFLNSLEGLKLNTTYGHFAYAPPNCRNCTGTNWSVAAEFQVNSFSTFNDQWFVDNLEEAKSAFEILINNKTLKLDELVNQNHATIELKGDESFKYVHITVKNLNELEVIDAGKENVAFIKLLPTQKGEIGEGLQINSMGGHNIDKVYHAGLVCLQEAAKRKIPLASTSWKFEEWQKRVPWGQPDPRTGYKPSKGQLRTFWTAPVVDLISTVTNNFN